MVQQVKLLVFDSDTNENFLIKLFSHLFLVSQKMLMYNKVVWRKLDQVQQPL